MTAALPDPACHTGEISTCCRAAPPRSWHLPAHHCSKHPPHTCTHTARNPIWKHPSPEITKSSLPASQGPPSTKHSLQVVISTPNIFPSLGSPRPTSLPKESSPPCTWYHGKAQPRSQFKPGSRIQAHHHLSKPHFPTTPIHVRMKADNVCTSPAPGGSFVSIHAEAPCLQGPGLELQAEHQAWGHQHPKQA